MELPPLDARLLPVLETAEVWVALDKAIAPPKAAIELFAGNDLSGPLLAGVSASLGEWQGQAVELYSARGDVCTGRLDRGAVAVLVQWPGPEGALPAGCTELSRCRDVVAANVWKAGGKPLLVARVVTESKCAAPHWARAARFGEHELVFARAVDDEHLANLAIGQFRRRAGWAAMQDRWLSSVRPLDSTEWDTSAGGSPEVARFVRPDGGDILTVSGTYDRPCDASFQGSFSATFRVGEGLSGVLSPLSESRTSWPGFAPLLYIVGTPDLFGGAGVVTLPNGGVLDARPGQIGGC